MEMMYETAVTINTFQNYSYLALFPVLAFGGPLAALGAGILASQGFFSPWLIWPMAICADIVADIFWYTLGRFGRKRIYLFIKNIFAVTDTIVIRAERLFERHGNKIIFFSKTTMGFGFLGQFMLTTQGFLKIPFRIFIFYNFLAGVVLSGMASFGGYYFGLALINMTIVTRTIVSFGFLITIIVVAKIMRHLSSAVWLHIGGKPTIHEVAQEKGMVKEN